jgi:uncharacterized flavoprotein (TIGR03862 family)
LGVDGEHGCLVSGRQRTVAIVGAGPAGLMAAEVLGEAGVAVTVFERMPSPARKFLMAGRGGLNLTHSEDLDAFLGRYPDLPPLLARAIRAFPPTQLIAWANGLGQETFAGSSGRIFPAAMKASPLLRAWLARLSTLGVALRLNHRWSGWGDDGSLRFATPEGEAVVRPDAVVLAVGGASWPRLGADGTALALLAERGVAVQTLQPANVGVVVSWSPHMLKHEGQPLKRVALSVGDVRQRGEVAITRSGLEGGAVYALGPELRAALADGRPVHVMIDLKPDEALAEIVRKLETPRDKQSASTFLRKRLALAPAAIGLLHEAAGGRLPSEAAALGALIKAVPVPISAVAGLERAISTAGGVSFTALEDGLMIRSLPGVFAAGEMLDWDAPTGGYLLQGCFAAGVAAAHGVLDYLGLPATQPAGQGEHADPAPAAGATNSS